ncbi:MAG: hypothetical protein EBR82_17260 [Caulobacteraceae bacterium]|nr:hypothetical protein [Caulobacteraceae bacterium]
MADLSITAASVIAGTDTRRDSGTAGAAITAGQVLAYDSSTATYKLADVNSASAWQRVPVGIALHAASTGQPILFQTGGQITIGATLTLGAAYYASGTPGGIRPAADNVTGDYPALLGIALSTTVLNLDITAASTAL